MDKPFDSRVDVWSLGCTIYEMGALEPAFYVNSGQLESVRDQRIENFVTNIQDIKAVKELHLSQSVFSLPRLRLHRSAFLSDLFLMQGPRKCARDAGQFMSDIRSGKVNMLPDSHDWMSTEQAAVCSSDFTCTHREGKDH